MKKLAISAWAMILAIVVLAGLNPMVNLVLLVVAFFGVSIIWGRGEENEHKFIEKDGKAKEE